MSRGFETKADLLAALPQPHDVLEYHFVDTENMLLTIEAVDGAPTLVCRALKQVDGRWVCDERAYRTWNQRGIELLHATQDLAGLAELDVDTAALARAETSHEQRISAASCLDSSFRLSCCAIRTSP